MLPRSNEPVQWTTQFGSKTPARIAAMEVTVLKPDPGGYCAWMVRFSSGLNSPWCEHRFHSSAAIVGTKIFGS